MIATLTSQIQYIMAGGELAPFNITFPFYDNTHIAATITDPSGNITNLVFNTDFILTGAGFPSTGGTIQLLAVAPIGTLTIQRIVPLSQLTTYALNDRFPSTSHERQMDLLVMMAQQLKTLFLNIPVGFANVRCGQIRPTVTGNTAVVFSVPFLDTNYAVITSIENSTNPNNLVEVISVNNKTANGFTINLSTNTAGNPPGAVYLNWVAIPYQ